MRFYHCSQTSMSPISLRQLPLRNPTKRVYQESMLSYADFKSHYDYRSKMSVLEDIPYSTATAFCHLYLLFWHFIRDHT